MLQNYNLYIQIILDAHEDSQEVSTAPSSSHEGEMKEVCEASQQVCYC